MRSASAAADSFSHADDPLPALREKITNLMEIKINQTALVESGYVDHEFFHNDEHVYEQHETAASCV